MKKGKSTGAKALVRTLEKAGTELIFGYPGGANLPIYEALQRSTIRHIQARHEQGAAHMADGFARASGKTGVCLATSGPGATNLVTGIATAYMDSSPMLAITGQVSRTMIGNDAFQEVDITGITMPITKHNYLIQSAHQVAPIIEEAFYLAGSGRRGPVVVDIPKDVQTDEFANQHEKRRVLEGYNPTTKGHPGQIKRAAAVLREAQRPVIIAGGGVISSNTYTDVAEFVKTLGIPVVHTLMGKSAFDNYNPLNLGLFGYHGSRAANTAVSKSDLILAIGTRFGDRSTGPLASFARDAKIIHIDVDPAEIGKNVPAYLPIVGDIADVLPRLTSLLSNSSNIQSPTEHPRAAWTATLLKQRESINNGNNGKINDKGLDQARLTTPVALAAAAEAFPNALLVTDVGRHQIFAAQHFPVAAGRNFITSGGLGTMGFGLPAAIGAALAQPEKKVVLITGDGSFLMNIQELITAAETGINLTVMVMNDRRLGMIQQLQDGFYSSRFDVSRFTQDIQFDRLAADFGCRGDRAASESELQHAVVAAAQAEGVTVIDCKIGEEEHVYPMVTGRNLLELTEGEA
ncbi:MAG: biosynthetic-type acetolactate synthase large subunit [Spirochaetaceae bacterium]|nr:biosynthetic-type acetolactate synthase large subunit [Spirochaetaceae bacterium]MCF7948791.1 biosynthetic-type acetolactate synthase large subunit [Spirochaetia bacterium]MCF7951317.1 biosynthetic-type acetolactate synthase large subunit [Spirochaetaceae bacterium]